MRIALAAALLAVIVLPGCQERPETFHVLPAFQRGLLADAALPLALPDPATAS